MSRKNLLADIRKLRSDDDHVSPAPKPKPKPKTVVKHSFDVDNSHSKLTPPNDLDDTTSTVSNVRRKKKKKKKKNREQQQQQQQQSQQQLQLEMNDNSNRGNINGKSVGYSADAHAMSNNNNNNVTNMNNINMNDDFDSRMRMNTRISVLEDGIPNSRDILNFSNYSPNLQWTFAFGFLASIDIMINIPTLYDAVTDLNTYSGSSTYFYVYIFSVYVGMQLVGTVMIGNWIDRRPIVEILAFSAVLMAIGNLLYTHGVAKHLGGLLLCGRGLCGVAASILVVGYAHVTRYTKRRKRESRIQSFRFVTASGTIFGPLLGVVVSGGSVNLGFWEITDTNAGAFIVMCLSLLYLISLLIWMFVSWRRNASQTVGISRMLERSESFDYGVEDVDTPVNAGGGGGVGRGLSASPEDLEIGGGSDRDHELSTGHRRSFYWAPHRFCSVQAFILWFLYCTAVFTFWSFEAAILPIGGSTGNSGKWWNTQTLYSMFVFIGVVYLLSFMANRYIADWFRIRKGKRVIASLLLMVIGAMFLTDLGLNSESGKEDEDIPPTWQVVLATPFLTLGFCIATLQLPAMYCKLVGASMGDLGIRMSWFFALASIGMLAGPVYGFIVIDTFGTINFVAHTSALLLLIAALIGFGALRTDMDRRSSKFMNNTSDMRKMSDIMNQEMHVSGVMSPPRNELQTGLLGDRL